jgi:hypothetical protein
MAMYNVATNSLGTKDWLEATESMTIQSYTEDFEYLPQESVEFSEEDFEQALRSVSRRITSSEPAQG